ncbi:alpha-2-macroglobulin-like protein 1 [Pelodytes ibericus]
MWNQILIICSFMFPSLGQTPLPYYLLLVPAEVHYPSNEKAYVEVTGARENLLLTVTLQTEGSDITLYKQNVSSARSYHSIFFEVPAPSGGIDEVVSMHISLLGPSTQLSKSKKILIRHMGSVSLTQTDKSIYKPGDTVNFWILTFDRDFHYMDDRLSRVELQDPRGNCIEQWLDLQPQKGMVNGSFSLDPESPLGTYVIKSPQSTQTFDVVDSALPTFKVDVILPKVVTIMDVVLKFKVCARFTYAKPVKGDVQVKLCRPAVTYYWHSHGRPMDRCTMHNGQTDKTGCMSVEASTEDFQLSSYDYQMKFEAEASLVEAGTGTRINGTGKCRLTATMASVKMDDTEILDSFYKPGLRYKGNLQVVGPDGSPLKSKTVYLTEQYSNVINERVYETDKNGNVCFTLSSNLWNGGAVSLWATVKKEKPDIKYGELNPHYVDAYITLMPFGTIANSFLKIQPVERPLSCHQVEEIEVDYLIRGSELLAEERQLEIRYVVMGKGNLVLNGHLTITVNRNSVSMGTLKLPLKANADIAPTAFILVYTILNNGHVAADTERFEVERCFNNQVFLSFSKNEVSPGGNVSLHLSAAPGSLCAVRAVDEGVFLMKPDAMITSYKLYKLLALRNRYGYPYRVQEEDITCLAPHRGYYKRSLDAHKRRKRFYEPPAPSSPDVFKLIKRLGLKILTNTIVKKARECNHYPPMAAHSFYGSDYNVMDDFIAPPILMREEIENILNDIINMGEEVAKNIRRDFPETWIWKQVVIGPSGKAAIDVQVPHTITEWMATTVCMADVGLGLAETASLLSFKPMFIQTSLPFSMVRGETFALNASVFNYLNSALMVKVTLPDSAEMRVISNPSSSYTQCLPSQETKVFTWDVTAQQIGSIKMVITTQAINSEDLCGGEKPLVPPNGASDTIIKTLIVKPEGIPVETVQNTILCSPGSLSSEKINISLPPDVVPGSARAEISVVGDLLGNALAGIENLVALPRGCGEQIMIPYAVNVYILRYLERTNRLSDFIRNQGIGYMKNGYQRELNYKRMDGSFSTFGDRDDEGNTWLCAFVMKIFYASSDFIFVDQKHIHDLAQWLKDNQLPNGCFASKGKLFKTSMKGGVNDEVSLTAYVTSALLEIQWPIEDEMVQNALQFLRSAVSEVDDENTLAKLAYIFTLAGDVKTRASTLKQMHKKAVNTGGQIFWPLKRVLEPKSSSPSKPHSFEVETASYMILAHLSTKNPAKTDITTSGGILSWVVTQQNLNGGFASTQDTVVALQAFCRYAELTSTGHVGLDITVKGQSTLHRFLVDDKTQLLRQKKPLPKLPGSYTVMAKGEGCAYLQTILRYNINPSGRSPSFDLQVTTTVEDFNDLNILFLKMNIVARMLSSSMYFRYTGQQPVTNMILIEVDLLSGFSATAETLKELEKHKLVKRIENKGNEVVIYVTELSHDVESFSLSLQQDIPVKDLAAQRVKLYDYYNPEEEEALARLRKSVYQCVMSAIICIPVYRAAGDIKMKSKVAKLQTNNLKFS